jgi:hypothetical protein
MQQTEAIRLSDRLDATLDWLSASHRRAALTLLVIALVALLPGFARCLRQTATRVASRSRPSK